MTSLETEWNNILWFSQPNDGYTYDSNERVVLDDALFDPTFPSWVFGAQSIEDRPQASFTQILARVS